MRRSTFCLKLLTAYGGKTRTHTPFTIDAFRDSTGRTFGPVTVPASDVVAILENMILLVLPLANPAGRDFVLASQANKAWRKNRSFHAMTNLFDDRTVGVDINRNFDYRVGFGYLLRRGRCGRNRSPQKPGRTIPSRGWESRPT